jgi:hypothetical protein
MEYSQGGLDEIIAGQQQPNFDNESFQITA